MYANLIINGQGIININFPFAHLSSSFSSLFLACAKEKGFHVFLVQLRDENHLPMQGVEVGEVGPKIGDNGTETGFCRLHDVRIPRHWMLMKNQEVTADGEYRKNPKVTNSKMQYGTMLQIRSGLVMGAGYRLAQGVTIAVRYSCVRHQGFVNTTDTAQAQATSTAVASAASNGSLRHATENAVLDYQNQQYRVLKQLCLSYAFVFTGKSIGSKFKTMMANLESDQSGLPEMHASSAGLKALCTFEGAAGLEECRKCCGGHGVLLMSGVAQMALDYTTYNTAEGDRIILELQSARFLIKEYNQAINAATPGSSEYTPHAATPGSSEYTPQGLCGYLAPLSDRTFDPASAFSCSSGASTPAAFKQLPLLLALFRARALNVVAETGARLKAQLERGDVYDKAWNENSISLVRCSRVHCWYVILANFCDEVSGGE
jgi:acyl-CoA oxidase